MGGVGVRFVGGFELLGWRQRTDEQLSTLLANDLSDRLAVSPPSWRS